MEFKTTQIVILFIYYFFSQWTLHEERVKFPTEKTIMSKVKLLACKPAMEMTFTNLKTQFVVKIATSLLDNNIFIV